MIRDIVISEYIGIFLIWLVVSVVYHFATRGGWRHTPEGRLMMADSALFVWIFGLILSQVFLHNWPGRVWVTLVSLALFAATGVWRLRLILAAQRRRRALFDAHASQAQDVSRDSAS